MSEGHVRQVVRAVLYLVVTGSAVYLAGALAYDFGGWRSFGRFLGLWSLGWIVLAALCYGAARVIEWAALIDRTLAEYPAWRYLRWPVWGAAFCLGAGTVYALLSPQTVVEASTDVALTLVALPAVLVVAGAFWGLLGFLLTMIERV